MRSRTSRTSPTSTTSPVSSRASRSVAARRVSPSSTSPPGIDQRPRSGARPRRTSSTRPPSTITAPTPTRGCSGYSRFIVKNQKQNQNLKHGGNGGKNLRKDLRNSGGVTLIGYFLVPERLLPSRDIP